MAIRNPAIVNDMYTIPHFNESPPATRGKIMELAKNNASPQRIQVHTPMAEILSFFLPRLPSTDKAKKASGKCLSLKPFALLFKINCQQQHRPRRRNQPGRTDKE